MDSRQGFSDEQKQQMVLSSATDNGMRITGMYVSKRFAVTMNHFPQLNHFWNLFGCC